MFGLLHNILLLKVIMSPAPDAATSPGFGNDKFIFREEIAAVTPHHWRKHYRNVTVQQSLGHLAAPGAVLPAPITAPILAFIH